MKRSEMVEIMTRVILNSETEFRLNEEEAELLLKAMEDRGMNPPLVRDGAGGISEYWEKEDETK